MQRTAASRAGRDVCVLVAGADHSIRKYSAPITAPDVLARSTTRSNTLQAVQNALVRAILGGEAGIGERDSSVDCTLDLIGQTYPQSTTQVLEPHTRISMNVIACISSDKGVEGMIHNGVKQSDFPRLDPACFARLHP